MDYEEIIEKEDKNFKNDLLCLDTDEVIEKLIDIIFDLRKDNRRLEREIERLKDEKQDKDWVREY